MTAAPLWRTMPIANCQAWTKSPRRPNAIPSNTACTARARTTTSPADLLITSADLISGSAGPALSSAYSVAAACSVPISYVLANVVSATPSNPALTASLSTDFSGEGYTPTFLLSSSEAALALFANITLSIRSTRL